MIKRTVLSGLILTLCLSASDNDKPYAAIFKKPYRQSVGLGISGIIGLSAVRNFIRCLHGKPVGAIVSAGTGLTSAHFFVTVEANSPTPCIINKNRLPALAQYYRQQQSNQTAHPLDALNGIKLKISNARAWGTRWLITQFDQCFGDEEETNNK